MALPLATASCAAKHTLGLCSRRPPSFKGTEPDWTRRRSLRCSRAALWPWTGGAPCHRAVGSHTWVVGTAALVTVACLPEARGVLHPLEASVPNPAARWALRAGGGEETWGGGRRGWGRPGPGGAAGGGESQALGGPSSCFRDQGAALR